MAKRVRKAARAAVAPAKAVAAVRAYVVVAVVSLVREAVVPGETPSTGAATPTAAHRRSPSPATLMARAGGGTNRLANRGQGPVERSEHEGGSGHGGTRTSADGRSRSSSRGEQRGGLERGRPPKQRQQQSIGGSVDASSREAVRHRLSYRLLRHVDRAVLATSSSGRTRNGIFR